MSRCLELEVKTHHCHIYSLYLEDMGMHEAKRGEIGARWELLRVLCSTRLS